MRTVQSDNVCASAWQDNKVVTVMYTGYSPLSTSTVQRRQKDGSRQPFNCPAALAAYNRHMGGVDRGDQLRGYYTYRLKSRKFYRYIFNFYLGVGLTNAFILYRSGHPGSRLNLKRFHEIVATELIGDYCSRRQAGRVSIPFRTLPLRHFPMKPPSETAGRNRHRCRLCQQRNRRKDTYWFCADCDAWLCHQGTPADCFRLWHQRRQQL